MIVTEVIEIPEVKTQEIFYEQLELVAWPFDLIGLVLLDDGGCFGPKQCYVKHYDYGCY